MPDEFSISTTVDALPDKIYEAYLSGKTHAAFTGSRAKIDGSVGGSFMAWDGYITGKILELVKNEKIVQSWRTTEFEDDDADSVVEIALREEKGRTVLTLTHKSLPEGTGEEYEKGWKEFYFEPMKEYFLLKKN
jgi:activator of HSP90 ATPase